jgi:hypothetical protein
LLNNLQFEALVFPGMGFVETPKWVSATDGREHGWVSATYGFCRFFSRNTGMGFVFTEMGFVELGGVGLHL